MKSKNALLLLPVVCFATLTAVAQDSVQLNNFRSAETAEDGFAVSRPDDRGHLNFGAQLYLDYALNPLVLEETRGMAGTERQALVAHQITGNVGLSLGLWDRLVLFAGLPVNILMSGDIRANYPSADGFGLSDVWLGGRVRFFGERSDIFSAALQLTAYGPTADYAHPSQHWSGDIGWTLRPELVFELRFGSHIRFTANAGVHIRLLEAAHVTSLDRSIDLLNVGHEFVWAAGLTVPFIREHDRDVLAGYLEAYGRNTLVNSRNAIEGFGSRDTSSGEAILGLKLQPSAGVYFGLAAGTGIMRGYGSPDLRLIGTVGYAEPVVTPEPAPEPEATADHDRDGDGIVDSRDRCPDEPEDVDAFEDNDGCPDPDNDGDLVLDVSDAAPNVPEDPDGFQDEDGAPEPDNDADTVLDPQDQCPLDPGLPADSGCPRTVRVDRETGQILVLEKVEFATNRDTILERSFPILQEVRAVLAANPQILLVRIEGHTDDRGEAAFNLDLSVRRVRSVRAWLTEHGIDGARLVGFGCGETLAIESNNSARGRQANRRVEFHILNPAPSNAASSGSGGPGCVEAH